jgi:hypothetical protein
LGRELFELLRSLKWMEPAVEIARLGCFALFVALGLMAARTASPARQRRRVNILIAYALAVSALVGLVQQESWPFSNWALVSHPPSRSMSSLEVQAFDAEGHASVVDLRVLQPVPPEDLAVWMKAWVPRMDAGARAGVGRFLLQRAEEGRQRLRAGRRVAPNQWILGPAAAPYHFHDAKTWADPAQVTAAPFTRVRASFLEWNADERFADESRVSRRLLLEYPPGS